MTKLGAERRSRKPRPDSPDCNLLAKAADATALDDHFEMGLTALLRGFQHSDAPAS